MNESMELVSERALATSLAIEKLVPLATGECSKLLTVVERAEVQDLKAGLELLNCILKDVNVKPENVIPAPSWLRQIKEVADLAEDAANECALKVMERRHHQHSLAPFLPEDVADEYALRALKQRPRQRGFPNFVKKSLRSIRSWSLAGGLASDIQHIKTLLVKIQGVKRRYYCSRHEGSSTSMNFRCYCPPFVSPLVEEFLVGIDSARNELVKRLTEGESRLSVISIVGAGGIGKTTLAKMVYHNELVSRHFDFCAWITVTQSHDIKEILKLILIEEKHDAEEIDAMGQEELIRILRRHLRSKRYIFVFDDVWRGAFFKFMKDALPDEHNGSRVIVTTRLETVAASCKQCLFDHVHKLEPLSEAMSWDLFCKIAFQYDPEQCCPPELVQLSQEFVRICEGQPLALVAVAGLLLKKEKISQEWHSLLDSFSSQLKSDPHLGNVSKILALSFDDLRYLQKLCFLYFSIFPKGSIISYEKLFKLWIAEGFVEQKEEKTLEETAEEILEELIQNNIVEPCGGFYGIEKFCRVRSLMHEIVRQKAEEFGFCHIWDGKKGLEGKICRLSICNIVAENALEAIEDSQVHSVFLFNIGNLNKSILVSLFEKCKLLTMLDFENVLIEHLPHEVGNLLYLKYLSLKNTRLKRLPKSVGNLYNLQTLDVRNTLLIELLIEINKLQNLRHLLASAYGSKLRVDSTTGVWIKEGISCLENLQTLLKVEAHLSGIGLIKELAKLRQLRRLDISGLTTELANALCASIEKMNNLEHLSLHLRNDFQILDLEAISLPPPLLKHLALKGQLLKFPVWISSLQNLSMLCLSFSRLKEDPLVHLRGLPNLASLWLYWAYEGQRLHFEGGSFQSLKLLVLRELYGLEVVEIEEGALPLLEELRIGPSPSLDRVPSGIKHLQNLKVLAFYDMLNDFVLSMQPGEGSEYWKVDCVPFVQFWYRIQGRHYVSYELGHRDLMDHLEGTLASNVNDAAQHHQHDHRLSFCYSDDDSDSNSTVQRNDLDQMSCASDRFSFFTDDIED